VIPAHQHLRARPPQRGQEVGVRRVPESLEDIGRAGQRHYLGLQAQEEDEPLNLLAAPRQTPCDLGVSKDSLNLFQLSLGETEFETTLSPTPHDPTRHTEWVDEP